MTTETIELLKNWEPKRFPFPGVMQEKFDGVPVIVTRYGDGVKGLVPLTRQGEYVKSIQYILEEVDQILTYRSNFIVGELYDASQPFKTTSGQVRDTKEQHRNLTLKVFDGRLCEDQNASWGDRIGTLYATIKALRLEAVSAIPGRFVQNAKQVEEEYDVFRDRYPGAEGVVIHSLAKQWRPGIRCWGTQRIKPQPTADLLCTGFRETHTDAGEPKGMVGACLYSTRSKGGHPVIDAFGPGCLTHSERTELWKAWISGTYTPRVAEVKYMKDDTYDALRQPTFLRWRPDKVS